MGCLVVKIWWMRRVFLKACPANNNNFQSGSIDRFKNNPNPSESASVSPRSRIIPSLSPSHSTLTGSADPENR